MQFRIIDTTTTKKSVKPDDYIYDLTRFILGAQDPRINPELRVSDEHLAELFLDKYMTDAREALPKCIRKQVLGKAGLLLDKLTSAKN